MSPLIAPVALTLSALILAGCAATAPHNSGGQNSGGQVSSAMSAGGAAPARACFRLSSVKGQKIVDRNTVLFRTSVGPQDVFALTTRHSCLSTSNSDPLVLIPSGGSDLVCSRLDLDVRVATPIGATPCLVQDIRKLTAAEVAVLPAGGRP